MAKFAPLELEYINLLKKYKLQVPQRRTWAEGAHIIREMQDTASREGTGYSIVGNANVGQPASYIQEPLDMLNKEIIAILGPKLNTEVYVGKFPTGSFNAQARRVSNGVLVLVNTGLMMFIYQTAKIMMYSVSFGEFDSGGIKEGARIGKSSFSKTFILEALAEVVLCYLHFGSSTKAQRFPAEGGAKGRLLLYLVKYCEKFVLAHEYGHIVAGHLDKPRNVVATVSVGDLELVAKSWEQELEADLAAIEIMLAGENLIVNDNLTAMKLELVLAGPMIFFALDKLITRVAMTLSGRQDTMVITDHPTAEIRMNLILRYYDQIGATPLLSTGNAFVSWIGAMEDSIVELIRRTV